MTKNQKILVGLGVAALAVYVYTRMGKKAQTPTSQAQAETGGMQLPTNAQVPTGSGGTAPVNITQDERNAIQEVIKQSGKRYNSGDVIVTRLGNFKYVIIKEGRSRSSSPFAITTDYRPDTKDWVRTTDKPQVYGTPTTRTIGEILK